MPEKTDNGRSAPGGDSLHPPPSDDSPHLPLDSEGAGSSEVATPQSDVAAPPSEVRPVDPRKRGDLRRNFSHEARMAQRENAREARKKRLVLAKERAYDPKITKRELANTVDPEAFHGIELLADARYEDIARRFLLGQSIAEMAAAHNMSERRLRAITREPGMVAAYLRVKAEMLDDIDKTLFDEKAAPLLRARAAAIRAQTMLAEVIEEVRARIADGAPSAHMLKVGVEAAVATIDRSGTELARSMHRGGAQSGVNVNVNVGNFRDGTGALLQGTITESGVDLSDILRARRVPNDDTPQPEAP